MIYKFLNFIKFIDLFGHIPSFVINQELKYKTIWNFIYYYSYFRFSFIMFFSIELFTRKAPSINLSTKLEPNPKKLYYFDNFEFIEE